MTKGLPDPPEEHSLKRLTFGTCNGHHEPIFTVRPGVLAEDALVHTLHLLQGAYQSVTLAREDARGDARRLLWGSQTSLEMAEALVHKVLDGLVLLPTEPPAAPRPEAQVRPVKREDID
ncbi:hypothetical protein PS627_04052 [Pseudomonas fluorescens]|uniref:DUF6124 family protein n=1 Tax=Pseudomonas fluorescens TaxID=294 RepID=UPI00125C1226|nr:hypothetical protein [Pseudomonas fluorescens]CAG8870576.1 hypothetical protein PS627_04052 [Pseudomonas fluorescens]VVP69384.1 hypothetical protein PS910_00572 [Pseudomonas fluorescens]